MGDLDAILGAAREKSPGWNGIEQPPQAVFAEENNFYGGNLGPLEAFPCGHEVQHLPLRFFLAEPVTPIGAQFSRYRSEPIGKPLVDRDEHGSTTNDGRDLDRELCPTCLAAQLRAGRAELANAEFCKAVARA